MVYIYCEDTVTSLRRTRNELTYLRTSFASVICMMFAYASYMTLVKAASVNVINFVVAFVQVLLGCFMVHSRNNIKMLFAFLTFVIVASLTLGALRAFLSGTSLERWFPIIAMVAGLIGASLAVHISRFLNRMIGSLLALYVMDFYVLSPNSVFTPYISGQYRSWIIVGLYFISAVLGAFVAFILEDFILTVMSALVGTLLVTMPISEMLGWKQMNIEGERISAIIASNGIHNYRELFMAIVIAIYSVYYQSKGATLEVE